MVRGVVQRRAARGLIEKDLYIPSERQDRAPNTRKTVHRQHGKPDAGITECGRHDDASQAEPDRHIARQQLHQAADQLIGDDQKRR
jgi:hypothetical protein